MRSVEGYLESESESESNPLKPQASSRPKLTMALPEDPNEWTPAQHRAAKPAMEYLLIDSWRRKHAELRKAEPGWPSPVLLNTSLPHLHLIANHGHLTDGAFKAWTFAALVLVKPQLFLDFPDLRVRHQGSAYHYDAVNKCLELDPVTIDH